MYSGLYLPIRMPFPNVTSESFLFILIVPCILKTKRPGVMSKSTQRSDPGILNSDRTVTVNEKALCHQRPIAVYAVCTFGGY
jgi:hypothetical protein